MTEYSTFSEANAARQIEWLGGQHLPLTFRTNEMAGELGEVAELLLDRWIPSSHMYTAWHRALADELADVIICSEIIAWQLSEQLDYNAPDGLARWTGTDYQWCAKTERDMGLLCNIAKKMDRTVYGIAGGVQPDVGRRLVMERVRQMVQHVYNLASSERIRMEVVVARKFNGTSKKVGLQTLYIPPGIDRALLIS